MIRDLNVAYARPEGEAFEIGSDLDDIEPVDDFLPETLMKLSRRIERSANYERLVYREIEMDEVWRLLDGAIADAERTSAAPEEMSRLKSLRAAVVSAHDLLEDPNNVKRAAEHLWAVLR